MSRPLTRAERASRRSLLGQAKVFLARARAGDRDALHVLQDIVLQLDEWEGQKLALALQNRTFPAGDLLTEPADAARNLRRMLEYVEVGIFPPRNAPCMPSRAALLELAQNSEDPPHLVVRRLWPVLQHACDARPRNEGHAVQHALGVADSALSGHGVERAYVETRRGPRDLEFYYVNMGETYAPTLVYDTHAHRFRVTSWGDMVETWERRFGSPPGDYDE